ncbi:MAG: MOSC domain-containing protein [Cyanobacterium sp. T60_A2020_053]|nr:MOSC domain-containing protein [Cyanobacterium sp. T60_A2020_053]
MKLSSIHIYPIKSCQGITVTEAEVALKGLKNDRCLMVVDSNGKFITQRQLPSLATIITSLDHDSLTLKVANNTLSPITFTPEYQTGNLIPVEIWGQETMAVEQEKAVSEWLRRALDIDEQIFLVAQTPDCRLTIDPKYSLRRRAPVTFSDGYPLLLTNTASLKLLNEKIRDTYKSSENQVTMDRFRPNLVIENDQPFAEDNWREITIGAVTFDLVKPCKRCIVTTTNQNTGQRNSLQEPLKTLATFRNFPTQGILFGVNIIPRNQGLISVQSTINL